jgi:hypothetical protein
MTLPEARAVMKSQSPPFVDAGRVPLRFAQTSTSGPTKGSITLTFSEASDSGTLVGIKRQSSYDHSTAPTGENLRASLLEKYGPLGLGNVNGSPAPSWAFTPQGSLAPHSDQAVCLIQAHSALAMNLQERKGHCGVFAQITYREENGLVTFLSTEMVDVEAWRSALERQAAAVADKARAANQHNLEEAKNRKPDI